MSINLNHTGNGNITLKSPNSGNPTLVFPSADGTSGQVLTTDGLGNLSFTTPSGEVTLNGTQTLTNKRITPRIVSITSNNLITPTADTADQYLVTALAVNTTITVPSGSPVDGQKILLRIKDDGTARTLNWADGVGNYRAIGVPLPTITVASKVLYVGIVYNSQDNYWDVIAIEQQV